MAALDAPNVPDASRRKFILASRASKLAQIQTDSVRDALQAAFPELDFETSFMTTEGDKTAQALYLLGGKALWTKELEVALREGAVDMLVHCCKDVPTVLPPGYELAAILERENPVDSLVVKKALPYKTLEELPDGSVVGTSSVRRVAQLRRRFPKLVFMDVGGNLNTRVAKLDAPDGPYTALVLAKAGMVRVGMGERITSDIGPPTLFYAVGQGALTIEIRGGDDRARELAGTLTHWQTQYKCLAERACLRMLEGGCSVPVGVDSQLQTRGEGKGVLKITGCVTSLDGQTHVEHTLTEEVASPDDAERVGQQLAKTLLETGAKAILEDVTRDRQKRSGELKSASEAAKIEATMEGTASS
ncbi:porphobilinogen deaminase [Gloeophyllum trabeum ATCC 11539]|uniref:Porphobilinogen deaminase n=1 Tax=Gloeophyllum trabeum (strain ATCC 11539 / FP-39264 / Madison 617) TaxID=670483 RepID=S7QPG2_GLOTA|nr:porphobilinogen deaminase [Gloeophyllum trabeum ATCC 11539]EPQ61217.1 porphobilinogen deaminase [Gloeophyllum trabeum ATCC 11539]